MLYIILLVSLVVRFINLNQSLWLDEAIGALVVRDMGFGEILTKFSLLDNHPPLYYLMLRVWWLLFGGSEISLRLPSVLFGIGTVFLSYKISKKFTNHQPLMTALFVASAPLLIYYSQEARMYMMATFLSTLTVYLYLNKKFLPFSLSLVALIFTDYVPVFLLPVFVFYSLASKNEVKKTLLSFIPLVVIGAFWLPTFVSQLETGKQLTTSLPAWSEIAGGATFKQVILFWNKLVLGRISFYPKEIYFGLIIICSLPFLYALFKSIAKKNIFFWLWFLLPLVLGFVASFLFPIFIYFRFLYVVPAFYILVSQIKNKLLVYLMIVVNLIGSSIYTLDKNQHRENWKDAVSFVEEVVKHDELVVFNYPESFAPYRYYATSLDGVYGISDSISVKSDYSGNKTERIVQNYNGLYYFEYLEGLTDPDFLVRNKIGSLGFKNVKTYTFRGVGEVEYLRK